MPETEDLTEAEAERIEAARLAQQKKNEEWAGLANLIHAAMKECDDDGSGGIECFDVAEAVLKSDWLAAREATARREALQKAAEVGLANGYLTIAGADFLESLAEPERDEEGR